MTLAAEGESNPVLSMMPAFGIAKKVYKLNSKHVGEKQNVQILK